MLPALSTHPKENAMADPEVEDPEVQALLREREGYVVRGKKDRVAEVDKALKRAGYTVKPETATTSAFENTMRAKPEKR